MAKEPEPIKKTKSSLEGAFDRFIHKLSQPMNYRGRPKQPDVYRQDAEIVETLEDVETRAQAIHALKTSGDYRLSVGGYNYTMKATIGKSGVVSILLRRPATKRSTKMRGRFM